VLNATPTDVAESSSCAVVYCSISPKETRRDKGPALHCITELTNAWDRYDHRSRRNGRKNEDAIEAVKNISGRREEICWKAKAW
jgi:hypothetical protein